MDMMYISFMTMSSNKSMINIAKRFNFELQETRLDDKKHNILFIRENDFFSYKISKSSSL